VKWLGYGIALLCAFLAIEIIVNAWSHIRGPRTLETKDYLIYVQMLITFLTAILLAVFNFAATRSNEQMKQRASADAAENLAKLQASLNAAGAQALPNYRPILRSKQKSLWGRYAPNSLPL
jgi:divalent metal cation (Fe/Co/Zn/Cd) transporter